MLTLGERDKIISFMNRTKVPKEDVKKYVHPIMKAYSLNLEQSLKKLINWAIDKKFEYELVREKKDGTKYNRIINLETLIEVDNNASWK